MRLRLVGKSAQIRPSLIACSMLAAFGGGHFDFAQRTALGKTLRHQDLREIVVRSRVVRLWQDSHYAQVRFLGAFVPLKNIEYPLCQFSKWDMQTNRFAQGLGPSGGETMKTPPGRPVLQVPNACRPRTLEPNCTDAHPQPTPPTITSPPPPPAHPAHKCAPPQLLQVHCPPPSDPEKAGPAR